MTKKIVIASNNKHKLVEFKNMLAGFEVYSLSDIGFFEDIDETGTTFEANAKIKANAVYEFIKEKNIDGVVLADDTGLVVNALGGEPGVFSARYAGNHDDEANRQKLLRELADKDDRSAYFECAICLKSSEEEKIFVGKTFGTITEQKRGSDAFGYDCVFLSDDLGATFGEVSEQQKDAVSHRGRALAKVIEYLNKN